MRTFVLLLVAIVWFVFAVVLVAKNFDLRQKVQEATIAEAPEEIVEFAFEYEGKTFKVRFDPNTDTAMISAPYDKDAWEGAYPGMPMPGPN